MRRELGDEAREKPGCPIYYLQGFFWRCSFGGEIAFVGRENVKNSYPKKGRNLLLFGGEIQNLGGEISPPKGPEKNTDYLPLRK